MLTGFLILALPVIALVALVVLIPFALYSDKHNGKQSFLYYLLRYVFIGYCLSLLYLTILWYYPDITFVPDHHSLNLIPFVWTREIYTMGTKKMAEQLVLNIGMFVPYGVLLPTVFTKKHKCLFTLLIVFCTTIGIEIIQFFMGRSADIDDVIMNFLGGALGLLFYFVLNHFLKAKDWWHDAKACRK